jgi:hypothetical protein
MLLFRDLAPSSEYAVARVRQRSWLVAVLLLALLAVACGDSGVTGGSSPAPSSGVILEVDNAGAPAMYLSSDNVDPSSIGADDPTSHKIASLPTGLVQICHYTLSQGVDWTVWAIAGSQDSVDLAKAYCQRNGQ